MKKAKDAVPASGLTVLFEPDEARNAVIEYVEVHRRLNTAKTYTDSLASSSSLAPEVIPSGHGSTRRAPRSTFLIRIQSKVAPPASPDDGAPSATLSARTHTR